MLKFKHNGVYWACLIAYGYSEVLGVDFSKNYSLVVNDITFHIQLLMVICLDFWAEIVAVETAILFGDLKEDIYMECPQGMLDIHKEHCIILNKCIYGLVQAATQYYKKAISLKVMSSHVSMQKSGKRLTLHSTGYHH